MNKIKVFIRRGSDGTYSVYVDLNDNTPSNGNTIKEAIKDFYIKMKKSYKAEGKKFVKDEFEFHNDNASFMAYYTNYFSIPGLSRLTGISQEQLSQYTDGTQIPSLRTIKIIDNCVCAFANNFNQVQFV